MLSRLSLVCDHVLIRTMFTVTPHPTKIKQEDKRKGVIF